MIATTFWYHASISWLFQDVLRNLWNSWILPSSLQTSYQSPSILVSSSLLQSSPLWIWSLLPISPSLTLAVSPLSPSSTLYVVVEILVNFSAQIAQSALSIPYPSCHVVPSISSNISQWDCLNLTHNPSSTFLAVSLLISPDYSARLVHLSIFLFLSSIFKITPRAVYSSPLLSWFPLSSPHMID